MNALRNNLARLSPNLRSAVLAILLVTCCYLLSWLTACSTVNQDLPPTRPALELPDPSLTQPCVIPELPPQGTAQPVRVLAPVVKAVHGALLDCADRFDSLVRYVFTAAKKTTQ